MTKKTLLVSVLSYFIMLVADIIIYSRPVSFEFLAYVIFYGIPVVGVIFGCLLLVNEVLKTLLNNKSKKKKNIYYFFTGLIITVVPTMGFVLFDYYNGGAFGNEASFLYIFYRYLFVFPFAAIAFLLNRKIVWKNFENKESDRNKE